MPRARWWGVRFLLALLATGCVVTRTPELAERPHWKLVDAATYEGSCLAARAFVRKSGKQGLGLALQLRSTRDCSFAVIATRVVFAGGPTVAAEPLAMVALPGRSLIYAWLPVRFDNDAAWNHDRDDATLELDVAIAGELAPTWRIAVHQQ